MKTIGRYQVTGLLGKGGMSRVYKVNIPVIDKVAAVKRLEPNISLTYILDRDQIKSLFIKEAKLLARIRHPHVVEIWDFDQADDKPFYVMDYHSHNLGHMIGESYLPDLSSRVIRIDRTIYYIRQALEGLACLHDFGIIHRDIKPYNMLVTEYDTLKISDLGLSKIRGETAGNPSNLKIGSPWYAAPEQEDDPEHVDFSADLYSVGVTLYRMLTGRLPLDDHLKPSLANPDLDDDWDRFISQAKHRSKHKRFKTARQMLAVMDDLTAKWHDRKDKSCSLIAPFGDNDDNADQLQNPVVLRHMPIKIDPAGAKLAFKLDGQFKPLHYIQNRFEISDKGQTVKDFNTGLIWQQSGSLYPQTYAMAHEYVKELNRQKFCIIENWRLPTIEELVSLLTQTPHSTDFCAQPLFDTRIKWLWSADRRSFTAAWYVSLDLGFVSFLDCSGRNYVKAVADLKA